MGTLFDVLVTLHLVCVIGGFGGLAYNALYVSLAQRRPGGGTSAILDVNRMVSGLAEILVYAVVLFGIGAVAASHRSITFADTWISVSLAIYVAAVGVLHGWIRPNQRRYRAVVDGLEKPAPPGESRAAEVAALRRYEKRVGFGWGAFNVAFLAVVALMVFQPK